MNNQSKSEDLVVTLWGVTGSGKSWLANAFAKELEFYSKFDEFDYELCMINEGTDECEKLVAVSSIDQSKIENTRRADDKAFVFMRKYKNDFSGSLKHQVSSFCHSVLIYDRKGQDLEDAVTNVAKNTSPAENTSPIEMITRATLQKADGLVLMLDPTTVQDSPVSSAGTYTREQYVNWMKKLFELIKEVDKNYLVALCLSKADIVPFYLPPKDLIEAIWGKGMKDVINSYSVKQGKITVEYFRVSAAGTYLDDRQNRVSNFDPATHTIIAPDKWIPLNAVAPFFWIFEKFEKQKLQRSSSPVVDRARLYIPYPEPRKP